MDSPRSISVHFFTGDVNSLREEQSKIAADSHHLSTSNCFLFAFMISKYQFMFEKTWNFQRSCGASTAPGWQNPTALKPLAKAAVKSWTRLWMTWDERLYLDHMQRWIVRVFFHKRFQDYILFVAHLGIADEKHWNTHFFWEIRVWQEQTDSEAFFFKNWNMLDHHDFATFEWHSRIMNRSTKIFVHGLFSKNRTFVRKMLYWVFIKIPGSSWCWEDLGRKGIRMPHTSATGQICCFSRLMGCSFHQK